MRLGLFGILSIVTAFCACTQSSPASSDDDSVSLNGPHNSKVSSSSKKDAKSSSSRSSEVSDEECFGEAGEPWDGTTAKDFACGAGTKLSPYIILTAEQLARLSFLVNSSDKAYSGKYFKLGADILLNKGAVIDEKGALVADSTKLHKWTPIGNSSVSFDGNFDGDGHSISGMFINTTSTHNGLFGNSNGTVQNLTVENSWVKGGGYSGGIVGMNGGSISGVVNYSSVIGSQDCVGGVAGRSNGPYPKKASILNSKNLGIVKGVNFTAGIAGQAYQATLENVENYGLVEGKNNVGGIAGRGAYTYVSSYFMDCKNALNYADVYGEENVGGILGAAGYVSPTISSGNILATLINAKNEGKINGKTSVGGIIGFANRTSLENIGNVSAIEGDKYVSGIVGHLIGSTSKNLYNTGNISGSQNVGGIIGYNQEGVTNSAYSTGKVDGDSLVGLMIGYNYNTTMADYYYLERGKQEPFGLNNGGGVATPKTEEEMKSKDFAKLLGDEFVYDSGLNDGYPVFKWEKE
ncbi:hypothetical protein [Fibrobacter succinogenes]|uniref:Lipoprotein n=1 Tax=Fibrobacter succinogenes TaxID=833 RepID=A0A380RW10_FIBSU|nr:hypothetical protein [Fibrobacter succinogenes]PWJ37228.1 hypothetical protein IE02_0710 [Fibrobacter succinogenes subsp. elongatus]SUQ19475.1 hypothetical protein SAMN05661053_0710 [Fibrobacter succinogenes]